MVNDMNNTFKDTINIGMLGHGFMGKLHSHAYTVIPHIFEDVPVVPRLHTVAGLEQTEADAFAKRFGYAHATTDWKAIVNSPEIDAIDVCLPEFMHEEVCLAALQVGKHILCEKPLALSYESARRVVEAAAQTKLKVMTGFNSRFLPAVRLAHDLIQQGTLGMLYSIRANYLQESGHNPQRPADQVRYAFGDKQLGTVRGLGSHLIDTARFLMGDVLTVSAMLRTFTTTRTRTDGHAHHVKADELASLQLEFASGAAGILTASAVATGRKNQLAFEVSGTKGSIAFDLENLNLLHVYLDDHPIPEARGFSAVNVTEKQHPLMKHWWPPAHILGWEHSHINEIKHFIECVHANRPIGPAGATFEDGMRAAQIGELAWRSSQQGRRLTLED
jgi:predicted dehydrogenase